jgi:hypothetical protein
MIMISRMPTFKPTKPQRKWMEDEKEKTGNSFSVILKGLIQKEIDKEEL